MEMQTSSASTKAVFWWDSGQGSSSDDFLFEFVNEGWNVGWVGEDRGVTHHRNSDLTRVAEETHGNSWNYQNRKFS
jgi:hypothetical protein